MIRFACPGCAMEYSVSPSKAGKAGKCPKCGSQFLVPDAADAPAPAGGGGTPMNLDPLPGSAPRRSLPDSPPPPAPAANASEPVEISPCPGCGARLSVLGGDLGLDVECPTCREVYVAKRAPQAVAPASPPPAPPSSARSGSSSRRSLLDEANAAEASRGRGRDDEDDEPRDRRSRRRREEEEELDDLPPRRRGRSGRGRGRVVLRRIGVLSLARVMACASAVVALVVAVPLGLFTLLAGAAGGAGRGAAGGNPVAGAGVFGFICLVVGAPLLYFVFGFLGGLIYGGVYNLVAANFGGVELELDDA